MAIHVPNIGDRIRVPALSVPYGTALSHSDSIAGYALARLLAEHGRESLEVLVDEAIALLDMADGDIDLEEDDPDGGNVDDDGEDEPWSRDGVTLQLPRYGIDQTRGPTNEEEAVEQWLREQHQPIAKPRPYLRSVGI